jgi:hypothetical protein
MDLDWWEHGLQTNAMGRHSQVVDEGTLAVTWGDGSGTGTGGTLEFVTTDYPGGHGGEAWMGQWSPTVQSTSSNWKEHRTLLATLKWEPHKTSQFRHCRLFYFMDNLVTYYIIHRRSSSVPSLHQLIVRLKQAELSHNCQLLIIHVPGTAMISQGTDGLSQNVWISPWNRNTNFIISDLFHPAPVSPELLMWAI